MLNSKKKEKFFNEPVFKKVGFLEIYNTKIK